MDLTKLDLTKIDLTKIDMVWFTAFVAIAGALLAAVVLICRAARRRGRELERERTRSAGEANDIRSALAALQAQMSELTQAQRTVSLPQTQRIAEATQTPTQIQPQRAAIEDSSELTFVPAPTLTADQRAEALGMLRMGAASQTVCAKLRLSQAETALLQKVQNLLDSTASVH